MSSKYDLLKELIRAWIRREKENYTEAKNSGGMNSCGAGMALGAIDAYNQVLADIAALEQEFSNNP